MSDRRLVVCTKQFSTGTLRRMALTLTTDERTELERRASSRTIRAEDAKRAKVILMLADGTSYSTIEATLWCYRDRRAGRLSPANAERGRPDRAPHNATKFATPAKNAQEF